MAQRAEEEEEEEEEERQKRGAANAYNKVDGMKERAGGKSTQVAAT